MKSIYIDTFQIHSNIANLGYVVHSVDGAAFPEIRQTKYGRPGESGAIVSNVLYDGRLISIAGTIFAETPALFEQRRRAMQNALSVTKDAYAAPVPLSLKMTTMDDLLIQVDCHVESFIMKKEQMHGQDYMLQVYAPDPAFLSQSLTVSNIIKGAGGGAIYPLIYPAVYDATVESQVTVTNNGTIETYPVIYLNGPLTNPLIQNLANDRFVDLNLTLNTGDQVVIDMLNKTIIQNGSTSVIANKTTESKWWWLEKGANLVRLITDNGSDAGNAQIQYRDAYAGI